MILFLLDLGGCTETVTDVNALFHLILIVVQIEERSYPYRGRWETGTRNLCGEWTLSPPLVF